MQARRHFFRCFFIMLLYSSISMAQRSNELNDQTSTSLSPATKQPSTKRWYTNLKEAKRVANDTGRPIMIVFR